LEQVADVASGAGVSLSEAKKSLTALAQLAGGNLEVMFETTCLGLPVWKLPVWKLPVWKLPV
jgi:hypothetical protein